MPEFSDWHELQAWRRSTMQARRGQVSWRQPMERAPVRSSQLPDQPKSDGYIYRRTFFRAAISDCANHVAQTALRGLAGGPSPSQTLDGPYYRRSGFHLYLQAEVQRPRGGNGARRA